MDKKYKNKEWLRKQYKTEKMTTYEIAEECEGAADTIRHWLHRFNINLRSRQEVEKVKHGGESTYRNKNWLHNQYIENEKSCSDIAQICNIDPRTIRRWLRKFNIKVRSQSEGLRIYSGEGKDAKYRNKRWLEKQIIEKQKTHNEIAEEFNISRQAISFWANKYNIEVMNAQIIKDDKKKCSYCSKWLDLDKFYKDSRKSTGLSSECRSCHSEHRKKWYKDNRDYKIRKDLERRKNNPTKRLNLNISSSMRKALKANKNGRHWESLVPYDFEDLKEHLENQFKDNMTWDNYGDWHIDHIIPKSYFDYENPEDEEFQQCWALDNLQPLWAEENLRKSDKIEIGEA